MPIDIHSLLKEEVQQFIRDHENHDPYHLLLQSGRYPGIPLNEAVNQIRARKKAKHKFPSWYHTSGIVYPRLQSLEQASSEITAWFKSTLVHGNHLVDLTGGLGVDSYFLHQSFQHTTFVESNPELVSLAQQNFEVLGAEGIAVEENEADEFLQQLNQMVDCIYLDPSRRTASGQRMFQLEDYQPDVLALKDQLFLKAKMVLVKLSPLLDIDYVVNVLGHVEKAYVVAVNNECRELLFLINPGSNDPEPVIDAVNLIPDQAGKKPAAHHFQFTRKEEADAAPNFSPPLQYLYEPNAALLKAGAFKSIVPKFGLKKLHPHSHLYTSEDLVADFPGRIFTIEEVLPYNKKKIKSALSGNRANITVRNFPFAVKDIRKELQIKEGGEEYLFATTDMDQKKVVLRCRKVEHGDVPVERTH